MVAKQAFEKSLMQCNEQNNRYDILLSYGFTCYNCNELKVKAIFEELTDKKAGWRTYSFKKQMARCWRFGMRNKQKGKSLI